MQKHDAKRIEALDRVEGFLDKNRDALTTAITSTAHENFSASRGRMIENMAAQEEHTRGIKSAGGVTRRLASRLLRKHMRPISVVARKQLPTVEEFRALTLPQRRKHFLVLAAAGIGMARAAKRHESTFIAAGLPADFIDQLEKASQALQQSVADKGAIKALRVTATRGLRKEGRAAMYALRLLDTLVRGELDPDNPLLDEWANVSRVAVAAVTPRSLDDEPAPLPVLPAGGTTSPAPGVTTQPPETQAAA